MKKSNIVKVEYMIGFIACALIIYFGFINTDILIVMFSILGSISVISILDQKYNIKWIKTPTGITYE